MPILTKKVLVKWTRTQRIMDHYINKGYVFTKFGDVFEVDVNDLYPTSGIKVTCQCDFCGEIFERSYGSVYKDGPINCSNSKCTHERCKYTLKKRYGVENVYQMEKTKESIRKTSMEHFGVDNPLKSEVIKNKVRKTNKERYGAEHPLARESSIFEKRNQTVRDRYGVDNVAQLDWVQDNIKQTCLERYNADSPLKNDDIKNKIAETNKERYGAENVFASEIIKEQIKQQNMEKFGVEHVMQRDDVKKKVRETFKNNTTNREASKEQVKLCKLLNGVLNYHVAHRKGAYVMLDVAFPDEKFYIECDFGGHFAWAKIKNKTLTDEDIMMHDKKRDSYLHNLGWKNMRLLSKKSEVFEDSIMIKFVDRIKNELLNSNDNRVICDYDNDKITFEQSMKEMLLSDYVKEM